MARIFEARLSPTSWSATPGAYVWEMAMPVMEADRAPRGYHGHREALAPGWYLMDRRKEGQPSKVYRPDEDSALFYRLAKTAPTKEGILEFVDEFGPLGTGVAVAVPLAEQDHEALGYGESILEWRDEIYALRQAIRLWRDVQINYLTDLSSLITWENDRKLTYHWTTGPQAQGIPFETVAPAHERTIHLTVDDDVGGTLLSGVQPGDLIKPAKALVQRFINQHLYGRTRLQLVWDAKEQAFKLAYTPEAGGLLAVIWLHFARMVAQGVKYGSCKICRTRFEVSTDAARPDRIFCSPKCRTKAYRQRKETALRLYRERWPATDIAWELDLRHSTIEGWIASADGGAGITLTMACDACGGEDRRQIEPTVGTAERTEDGQPVSCHRLECGHAWHHPMNIECDCPDRVPQEKETNAVTPTTRGPRAFRAQKRP